MLTNRQAAILDFIVGEYIASATPVPSNSIAKRAMKVSSATVRNEMAELEEGGYILRRHISGGGIPSNKGYRFHVEAMSPQPGLSEEDEAWVRQKFLEAKQDVEAGTRVVTDVLSRLAHNLAVATFPKAQQARLKRLELVELQEALTLLVLVLQEARTRQRLLHLATTMKQHELTTLSNKLSALYGGSTREALASAEGELTPVERQVLKATDEILLEEDAREFEEPHVSGLRHLLNQPEFANSDKMRRLVDVLEDRTFLKQTLPKVLAGEQFRAVIGEENETDEMQECSVLVSRYGSANGIRGLIAVIGPTRMEYRRSIGSVKLLSSLMNDLVNELS